MNYSCGILIPIAFPPFPWEEAPIFQPCSSLSSSCHSSASHVMPIPEIENQTQPVQIVLYWAYREGEINRSRIAARRFQHYSVCRAPDAGGVGASSSTIPASPELRLWDCPNRSFPVIEIPICCSLNFLEISWFLAVGMDLLHMFWFPCTWPLR